MGNSTTIPHPLPEPLVEIIATRFKVLGEPMRIRLLDQLRSSEASVSQLTEALDTTQQNVSKHLNMLLDAGIVGRRKDGNHAYYRIVDDSVFDLCEMNLCNGRAGHRHMLKVLEDVRQGSTKRTLNGGHCNL